MIECATVAASCHRQIPWITRVLLDGNPVEDCILADEDNGIMYCYAPYDPVRHGTDSNGVPCSTHPEGGIGVDAFGNLLIEQRTGVVRIVRDAREETKLDLIFGDSAKGYSDAA